MLQVAKVRSVAKVQTFRLKFHSKEKNICFLHLLKKAVRALGHCVLSLTKSVLCMCLTTCSCEVENALVDISLCNRSNSKLELSFFSLTEIPLLPTFDQ